VALDGVSWVRSGSVEIAVGQRTACYRIGAVIAPSLGRRSARELGSISSSAQAARLCWVELGAVSQHGLHDNGETTGERDPCLAHRGSSGDREGPVLQLQRPLVARQHDVRGLIEERAKASIAALRDAAAVVNLARPERLLDKGRAKRPG